MKALTGALVALVIAALVGAGCNTIKGAGQDIEKGGRSIQNAADRMQKR